MQAVQIPLLLVFPALAIVGALKDLTSYTIPNWISLALLVAFVPAALVCGASLATIGLCLAVGLGGLVMGMGMFAAGWIGGGDAKIAAAAGLWFGFSYLTDYLVYASLFGGALTLLLLQFRQWPVPYAFRSQEWLLRLHSKDSGIPYGIALAIGALMIYPETGWMRAVDLTRFVGQ